MNNDIKVISKKVAMSTMGVFIELALVMGFNIIAARNVNLKLLGDYLYVYNIIIVLSLVLKLGFDNSIVAFLPKYDFKKSHEEVSSIISVTILITIVLTSFVVVMLIIFSKSICTVLLANPDLEKILQIQAPLIIVISLTYLCRGIYISTNKIGKYIFAKNILMPLVSILVIGFVVISKNTNSLFLLSSSYYLGWCLAFTVIAFDLIKGRFTIIPRRIYSAVYIKLIRFSLPIMFSKIISIFLMRSNIFFIGYFLMMDNVVIYSSAAKIAILISYVTFSFNSMFGPKISEYIHKNELLDLKELYINFTRWVLIFNIGFFIIVVSFAKEIMLVFNSGFGGNASILVLLVSGEIIGTLFGAASTINVMSGNSKSEMFINMTAFIINAIMCIVLIPYFGVFGATITLVTTALYMNLLRFYIMYKKFSFNPFTVKYFFVILSGLMGIGSGMFARVVMNMEFIIVELVITFFAIMMVYGINIWFFSMDIREKRYIINKIKQKFPGLLMLKKVYES